MTHPRVRCAPDVLTYKARVNVRTFHIRKMPESSNRRPLTSLLPKPAAAGHFVNRSCGVDCGGRADHDWLQRRRSAPFDPHVPSQDASSLHLFGARGTARHRCVVTRAVGGKLRENFRSAGIHPGKMNGSVRLTRAKTGSCSSTLKFISSRGPAQDDWPSNLTLMEARINLDL